MDSCSLKDIFLKILSQDADDRLQGETTFSNKANNHQFALSFLRMTEETNIDDNIKISAANKFKEFVTSHWESSLNPILESEKKEILQIVSHLHVAVCDNLRLVMEKDKFAFSGQKPRVTK
ncbi:glutathione gamma-glutamylcysteinyltransferase 1 [Tanacetum coccineum]